MLSPAKTDFLAVYDYGMGGVWVMIKAREPAEITAKFPDLRVFVERPGWMSDGRVGEIPANMRFDIDDAPSGFLLTLLQGEPR